MHCCRTAPTAISEASVIILVGASGVGWTRRDASARALFTLLKAVIVSSVHSDLSACRASRLIGNAEDEGVAPLGMKW